MYTALLVFLLSQVSFTITSGAYLAHQKEITGKTYAANLPAFGTGYSMTLTGDETELTAHRSQVPISSSLRNDILFFDAKPGIIKWNGLYAQISDIKNNLWFVPFQLATPAIPLGEEVNQCLLYQCIYGSVPNTMDMQGQILETALGLQCQFDQPNPGKKPEKPFSIIVPCDSLMSIKYENIYTAGVIVRAEKVNVLDPIGTKADTGIKFFEKEDGSLILYEDAVKQGLIKE